MLGVGLINGDFGKETELLHEMFITGRKVGATKDFLSRLAHDEEQFRRVLDAVYNAETFTLPRRAGSVVDRLELYALSNGLSRELFTRFSTLEFPLGDTTITLVGGLDPATPIANVHTYLELRGYRPVTLPEGMLLVEREDFLYPNPRQRHFPALGTFTGGPDGNGVFFPLIGGSQSESYVPNLFFSLSQANQPYGCTVLPAIKLQRASLLNGRLRDVIP